MSFHRARTPLRRQYQRAAIGRAYAMGWREADAKDLVVFVGTVNNDFAGRPWNDWTVKVSERRHTITLLASKTDHRATMKPGTILRDGNGYRPISADDILRLEYRVKS